MGSSPRVRSRRPQVGPYTLQPRIISACAEQTGRVRLPGWRRWDHLRVCGADEVTDDDHESDSGSSPRVRSRRQIEGVPAAVLGIISACAEQTRRPRWSALGRRDHLRVCGADSHRVAAFLLPTGSSPRVRSRRDQGAARGDQDGIISACAEQTRRPEHALSNIRDHLRVCGADKDADMANRLSAGSSPRVRSRPVKAGGACFGVRIISACAEQTRPRGSSWRPRRDHLRVCGAD